MKALDSIQNDYSGNKTATPRNNMQKHYARVDFSGQQSSCMVATSWTPDYAPIGSNKLHILKLEDGRQHSHYVSASSSGLNPKDRKSLRINGNFGRSLNLINGEELIVSEISQTQITVKTAFVSCVCEDDWEILESNSEIVTNSLLNQLRVVYNGLRFPFWVTKSMTINLKIDKIDPEVEFGILDSSSEVIIPSLTSSASVRPKVSINGLPKLRLHPVQLYKSEQNLLVPSVTLLLNNIRHCFVHSTSIIEGDILKADNDNEQNSYFFAKFFGGETTAQKKKTCPEVVKVFILDNLDINEQVLRKSFPLTNPPSLYVHPKLVEGLEEYPLKSSILLEQTTEDGFVKLENQYSPIELRDEKNISLCSGYAGFQRLIHEGLSFLKAALSMEDVRHGFVGPSFGSLFITGREGSGKTSLALRLIDELADHPLYIHSELISCPKLKGKKSESVEKYLVSVFQKAAKFQPSLVVLDDLDVLIPAVRVEQQNLAEEFQALRVSETLLDCMMQYEGQQIVFIATSKGFDSLNSYWKSRQGFHFFQKCIHIPPPNHLERLEIFKVCIQPYLEDTDGNTKGDEGTKSVSCPNTLYSSGWENSDHHNNDTTARLKLNTLSDPMKFSLSAIHDEFASPLMIRRIAEKWILHLFQNEQNRLNDKDEDHINNFQRIIDEEIKNFGGSSDDSQRVKLHWEQIGGLSDVKSELSKILEWPIKYPKLFENSPVKLPSGILLYGYPGSGKTLLGLSIPSIVNAKFIHIKIKKMDRRLQKELNELIQGPELLSKYIGSSEQSVKDLFQRAKDSKPCILFFDEFDSLVPRRGHDSTGVTDRVVNQFLAEMDGVDGGMGQGVHLIAATSRPDLIDPAILRPGRLDKHLFFQMPTKDERIEILKRQSEQVNLSGWGDEDWELIGRETEGFSGADLHSLLFSAQMASIQQYLGKLETNESTSSGRNENLEMESDHKMSKDRVVITMDHMQNALSDFQPSLQGKELQKFKTIYESFSSSRSGGSSEKGRESGAIQMSGKRATLA